MVSTGQESLAGSVALVTGAARGQGRAHAVGLARAGAAVIAVDACAPIEAVSYPMPTEADLRETARAVRDAGGRVATAIVDVRDGQGLADAVAGGVRELGDLTVVVANAGIWAVAVEEPTDPVRRARVWKDTIDVNLTGVWNTIEAATPHLIAHGRGGAVVITSSVQGLKGAANHDVSLTAYTASKHGVAGLMKAAALDLGEHGVRVNTVHPTGVLTPMAANDVVAAYADARAGFAGVTTNLLPVDVVEPEDVTNAILFLVGDTGRYVTGTALPVDAGFLVR